MPTDTAVADTRPGDARRVLLGGCVTDLHSRASALLAIEQRLGVEGPPLGVVSVNLDHLHHFRPGGLWAPALEQAEARGGLAWLNLVDGAPLASQSRRLTGQPWPRLAGSDLVEDILDAAARTGARVGFLGGTPETHALLAERLGRERPDLAVSGFWAPNRSELTDPSANACMTERIRSARTDVLVVGLGKPRQELWMAEHGPATGAGVLLAFGAVVDFLAGRVRRAPQWMSDHSLEWSYRLALEPRRLAHRYLIDGPPAYIRLRRASHVRLPGPRRASVVEGSDGIRASSVTAVVVTYQSEHVISDLLDDLAREAGGVPLRVVVKDNGSTDATVALLEARPEVDLVPDRSNVGYAGGINAAVRHATRHGEQLDSLLVLNPDVRLRPGALDALRRRLEAPGVGVAVPRIVDQHGETFPSLRRDPTVRRTFADALLGSRRAGRWSETVLDPAAYQYPHPVDWATGAALLVDGRVAREVGPWDERFFLYSEETDFLRRVRDHGLGVWFEPAAVVEHVGGSSGGGPLLDALMAVNRVRFAELHDGRRAALAVQAALLLGAFLRLDQPSRRAALPYLARRSRWGDLPRAQRPPAVRLRRGHRPEVSGAVVVPAHDEEAVIARTLAGLVPLARDGTVEVVVATNGCTDATADIARSYGPVRVVELEEASKVAALNAADTTTDRWPRLYVDADVEITATAVRDVLEVLANDDGPLAARPPVRYDTVGATALVRAFHRARSRIAPEDGSLWGAGVYGLSRRGHDRFGTFPAVVADDLFVDARFGPSEKVVVDTDPVVVRAPRDLAGLLAVLRRTARGNAELHAAGAAPDTTRTTLGRLVRTLRGPATWFDAGVYVVLVLAGRLSARRPGPRWERDGSTRTGAAGETS